MQSGTKEHELLKDGSFRHRLVQNFFRGYVENRFSIQMSERIFNSFERMYLRLRTYFDGYTQLCPRYKNKQPYNCKTKLCINIHNSAKLWCGKLGGKCGKAHGIVEKAKRFTRYRLYMERQYTLRIHFYDMLRVGTLKSSVKRIGNVISTYTIKGVCFQTKQKARRSEPLRAQSI